MSNHFADKDPAYELGARRMQVVLLQDALRRYGAHRDWCHTAHGSPCNCGLAEALRIGPDAREVCGLQEAK